MGEHQSTLHAFRDSRPCWHPPVTATRRRYVNLDRNFQCFFFPAATVSGIVWLQIKEEIFQSFCMTDFILSSFLVYESGFVIFSSWVQNIIHGAAEDAQSFVCLCTNQTKPGPSQQSFQDSPSMQTS